jgi:hypothetical protein
VSVCVCSSFFLFFLLLLSCSIARRLNNIICKHIHTWSFFLFFFFLLSDVVGFLLLLSTSIIIIKRKKTEPRTNRKIKWIWTNKFSIDKFVFLLFMISFELEKKREFLFEFLSQSNELVRQLVDRIIAVVVSFEFLLD